MKKTNSIITLILFALLFSGCSVGNSIKHMESSTVGLKRKITVYGNDGTKLQEWSGRCKIEAESPYKTKFVMAGQSVYISGGVTIAEEID